MSTPKKPYDRTSFILVVDDDDTLLKFFKIHLNKFFSRVIVVTSAKEAIATLKEKDIDLVISDIRMPRMDGLQLMKKVRAHDPAIPMFIVSGALLTDEQVEEVKEADGYLRKPFSIDDLHGFIDKGMKCRELLKELNDLVGDKKKLNELVRSKNAIEGGKIAIDRVQKVIDDLKKAS